MVERLEERYFHLKKSKGRLGKAKVQRDQFLRDLENTLWVVCKKTEEKLKYSNDAKCIEDWQYLELVRGTRREGTLGCIDNQELKKNRRKKARKDQKNRTAIKNMNICPIGHDIHLPSSSEEEIDIDDTEVIFNLERKRKFSNSKSTKKKQVITPAICFVAYKNKLGNRGTFEMVGAATPDIDLKDKILSASTIGRRKQLFAIKASEKIISDQLSIPSHQYTLHWDGKIFKALTRCGTNEDRVAVILTASGGEEILLGIIPVANGTAAEEHRAILSLLNERKIPLDKISACVFDTTSVNTGELNGIVRRLETSLNHSFLELACRHHIYELVCGAASEIVLGKTQQGKDRKQTTSPFEPLFHSLCKSWKGIDKDNLFFIEINSLPRTLIRQFNEAKEFLYNWLCNDINMRKDYLEMAQLCLIYLGGVLPKKWSKFVLLAPSAYSHARWMSKVLYVLKLAMLKPSFVTNIATIRSLALFYSVYYAKAWLTCIFAAEAPLQDLTLIKALEEVCCTKGKWPEEFQKMAKAAMDKLKCHTWYLSERLVGLALFSDKVDLPTKEKMRHAILKHKKKPLHKEQQRPECSSFSKKYLHDFVGPDTYHLFKLLNLNQGILNKPVSTWSSSLAYRQATDIIVHLSVVNDVCERALGLASSLHGSTMPKQENQLQATYKVVDAIRKIQGSIANSTERVSKKNLAQFLQCSIIQVE